MFTKHHQTLQQAIKPQYDNQFQAGGWYVKDIFTHHDIYCAWQRAAAAAHVSCECFK